MQETGRASQKSAAPLADRGIGDSRSVQTGSGGTGGSRPVNVPAIELDGGAQTYYTLHHLLPSISWWLTGSAATWGGSGSGLSSCSSDEGCLTMETAHSVQWLRSAACH